MESGVIDYQTYNDVAANIQSLSTKYNLRIYTQKQISNTNCVVCNNPSQKMIDDYKDGIIDFFVRGINNDLKFQSKFKTTFGYSELMRVFFVQDAYGRKFGLGPISAGEGEGNEKRLSFAVKVANFMRYINMMPKIAVMSRCRYASQNYSKQNKESWEESDYIVNELSKIGIEAKNVGIEIEKSVDNFNYILVVNGLVGNQIYRTLTFLGRGVTIGIPTFGIEDNSFLYGYEDNSRNEIEYEHHIKAAILYANNRKTDR
jgi:predicted methyltransferase MtxX (methanogen marker protein 4)